MYRESEPEWKGFSKPAKPTKKNRLAATLSKWNKKIEIIKLTQSRWFALFSKIFLKSQRCLHHFLGEEKKTGK